VLVNIRPVGLADDEPAPGEVAAVPLEIWDSTGSRQLRTPDGSRPTISISRGSRAAPSAIVTEVWRQLGLDVAFLRVTAQLVVEVEALGPDRGPAGWIWQAAELCPPIGSRVEWQQPGWLQRTMRAADAALARAGLTRVGPPAQVRHTSLTGMLRIDTDRHRVWLKAVPPLFAHEAVVVRWLSGAAEYDVPHVIASGDGWWLSADFPPAVDRPPGEPLIALADTQWSTASRADELRALECPDRPLASLPLEIEALARRDDLLDRDDAARLVRALPTLERRCAQLDALGFPPTLVHGDVSPGNVRWTGTRWLVYDWTDACIAHPFVELASPLSYEPDTIVADARAREFAAAWAARATQQAADRALALAPTAGAAHQAISYARMLAGTDRTGGDQASGDRLAAFARYWVGRLIASLG
jgi:hypothetical protein